MRKVEHQVSEPLQAASSRAHVLRGARHDGAFSKALARLHRTFAAQSHLIEDLLAASRIIAGKMRLASEQVMLAPVIDAAVVEMTKAAASIRSPPSTSPLIRRSARCLATEPGSNGSSATCSRTPSSSPPAEGRIDIRLERDGDVARIVVADTGRGIPPDMLSRLFDEFWQARTAGPESSMGLGLGLAIVRRLMDMHGGTVQAQK